MYDHPQLSWGVSWPPGIVGGDGNVAVLFRGRFQAATMTELSAKQLALNAVQQLPEDATLEDAMERLFFLEKIERGLADVRAGRMVPHEEVRRRFGLDA